MNCINKLNTQEAQHLDCLLGANMHDFIIYAFLVLIYLVINQIINTAKSANHSITTT